ncbi:MAG: DUF11 domain-containing protein [Candidatus Saccharibacteria bacterium]
MKFVAKLRTLAAAAALVLVPAAAAATGQVAIEARTAVANQTAGDTVYQKAVNAKTDEVVKVQVWYHNKEEANSNKVANNLKVKIDLPTTTGKSQVVKGTVSADNSNTVVDTANVNLALDQSRLEYIPGSAQWRHNTGTNEAPNWVTEKISDQVVGTGITLGNEKPCFNFEANVTVLARVKTPAVSITKQVRVLGEKDWKTENTAKAGDTLEYLISFKNEGNTTLNNVIIADNMPANVTYVPGTTMIKNGANPNGTKINSDNITKGGVNVGNYTPGANGYVWFQAKIDSNLKPGNYTFKNVGIVKPEGMGEYFNAAQTKVSVAGPTTVPPTTPVTPTTPTTPTTPALPQTGVEAGAAGLMGTGALTYAGYFYRKSRKGLTEALKNVVK